MYSGHMEHRINKRVLQFGVHTISKVLYCLLFSVSHLLRCSFPAHTNILLRYLIEGELHSLERVT
jgi:hypothetical protein